MSKLSKQKISMLGLILLVASAVTAAIIPNKQKVDSPRLNNGVLAASSVGSLIITCLPHPTVQQCTASAMFFLTVTSAPGGVTSADIVTATATPTSMSGLNSSLGA